MMKKGFYFSLALLSTICLSPTTGSAADKLLKQSDLEYLGAFRVSGGDGSPDNSGFHFGGTGLAFNPKNNSLFLVGHNWYQYVAEINIPEAIKSDKLEDLNTAKLLQNFADVTEGNRANIGEGGATVNTSGTPLGGFLVWKDSLIGTVYGYYDAGSNVKLSHFVSGLDITEEGDFRGMYKVGEAPEVPNPAFVGGYMAHIPAKWQSQFGGPALTGNCCLSIISRTSLGPAASVFNPDRLGIDEPVEASPVVGYPIGNPTLGEYGDQRPDVLYNGSMGIKGMVFPENTRSVIFFGSRGTGEFCYGHGVSDPDLHMTNCDPQYPTVLCCYDPVNSSKGGHSYPYIYMALAYDVLDLLDVKNGKKKMWEIFPYAEWEFQFPYENSKPSISGAAYDPISQKIYVAQYGGDRPGCCGYLPVIHVFKVNAEPGVLSNSNLLLLLNSIRGNQRNSGTELE